MTTRIQAVTGRKVLGNVAQRAYKTGDENVVGGNPIPVYKVDDAELVENGGQFKVSGNKPQQFLVYEVSGETPLGGSALPIYIVNDTPPVNPPNPPSNLTATPNGLDTIDLAWVDNSSNETGFQIERKLLSGGAFALIHTTSANITSYSDSGLVSETYEYRVRAINADGNSAYSNTAQATLPPIAPSNLVATENLPDTIDLTWTDNSTNETGFEIERRTLVGGVFALIHTTAPDVTNYSDASLTSGGYEYRIRAVNSGGNSAYSNTDDGFIGAYNATPNLVHVYEPARRTLTAYTGSLVRIRRSSDNAEQDFGADGAGNLDTTAIATFVGAGSGFVVTVYDQVGGNNPTQATAGNQPLYVASGQNGKPVMRFSGSHNLTIPYTTIIVPPFLIVVVAKLNSPLENDGVYYAVFDGNDLTYTNRSTIYKSATGDPDRWAAAQTLELNNATLTADSNWNLFSFNVNGASSLLWMNSVQRLSGNTGTGNTTGITIGSLAGDLFYWKGDIANIVVCDPSLSTTDRESLQTAINSFWAVY